MIDLKGSAIKKLLTKAKKRGYLTYDELNTALPQDQMTSEQIEDVMSQISDMGVKIVENDDGAGGQFRNQHPRDISRECRAVHRALDHPGRDQGILGQPRDECLRAPFADRCRAIEPLPDRGSSAQPREVRLDRRLVDKDQPVRLLAHAGLAALDPVAAGLAQCGSVTFRRDQSFLT